MGTRRALASVADGIAGAFIARTNDIGNLWAMGVLLEDAPPGDPDVTLDLVAGRMDPLLQGSPASALGTAWARYLRWSLAKHRLTIDVVRSATVSVDFDRSMQVGSWIYGDLPDTPFRVVVVIEDDRRGRYTKHREGHCGPPSQWQDPNPWKRPRPAAGSGDPGRMDWRLSD